MSSKARANAKKTYKREAACILLVLHSLLCVTIVARAIMRPEEGSEGLIDLALGMAPWVYGFAAAAFGLDSWAKQVNQRSRYSPKGVYRRSANRGPSYHQEVSLD